MKKHWYDYLWIASLSYLILGFVNILFAWLGLICFFLPLAISITAIAAEGSCFPCWGENLASPAKKMSPAG